MKRAGQSNVLLDEQAKRDARLIAAHFNLTGISAAIRYALRTVARQIEGAQQPDVVPPPGLEPGRHV